MLYISKTKRLAFDLETALQLDDANADERGCAFIDIVVCVAGLRIHRSRRNKSATSVHHSGRLEARALRGNGS